MRAIVGVKELRFVRDNPPAPCSVRFLGWPLFGFACVPVAAKARGQLRVNSWYGARHDLRRDHPQPGFKATYLPDRQVVYCQQCAYVFVCGSVCLPDWAPEIGMPLSHFMGKY
jgi:hypothetical protein